jgi:hypothetical protein
MSTIKVDGIRSNSATSDAITLASNGTCTANLTNNLSNRNMVINGSMVCSQRGSSFASITDAYCLDRFTFRNNNGVAGTFTVSQSTETPDGFGNSLKVAVGTADSALAAGETFLISTRLEGQNLQSLAKGTSSAKKSVLSFYVKTNKTGTYAVFIYDNDNTRQFSTTYTVSNTNWNRYTIDVPADTTGAFDNDNGRSLDIYWYLGAGTNSTSGTLASSWQSYVAADSAVGQVNFADSTSNEFYITGIQYEVNESGVATDFEHRSYAQELALCQRYFISKNVTLGTAYNGEGGNVTATTRVDFNPTMRAGPTITFPTNYSATNTNSDQTSGISKDGFSYGANIVSSGNYFRQSLMNATAEL